MKQDGVTGKMLEFQLFLKGTRSKKNGAGATLERTTSVGSATSTVCSELERKERIKLLEKEKVKEEKEFEKAKKLKEKELEKVDYQQYFMHLSASS